MGEKIMSVDPTITRHHQLSNPVCAVQIVAPNAVGQTIIRSIHKLNSSVFVGECHDVGNWAKDFFTRTNILWGASHQGWFDVKSAFMIFDFRATSRKQQ